MNVRIVVPIKQVPETNAVRMDEQTGTMIREGVEAIINPLDLYAIELAIRLREAVALRPAQGESEVVVISMGPPKAQVALREALAMGADSAVLISGKAFAGSDTWATSYALAAAIRRLGTTGVSPVAPEDTGETPVVRESTGETPVVRESAGGTPAVQGIDLVLCGERATDGDTGQVGPGIASFLDLPVLTYVGTVDDLTADAIRVHRLVEGGYEILDCDLPAVLTVVKEVAAPRLPTLRGKQKARKAEIPVWGPADLGVEEDKLGLSGSPTRVVKIFRPKVARQCQKHVAADEAAIDQAADKLVEFLRTKGLV